MSDLGTSAPLLDYLEVLSRVHLTLTPRTYLEIGSHTGTSLSLANCPSIAVDPQFVLSANVIGRKPICMMFQMTSDRFFSEHDPEELLGSKIDLAFIDGMHLFEFCLRDFLNLEAHARPNSVVAIHDVIPGDLEMARREPALGAAWTGDVWKMLPLLSRYRPDLKIICLDARPTGLALVTGLNPASRLLRESYFDLIEEFRDQSLETIGLANFRSMIPLVSPTSVDSLYEITKRFWL